MQAKKENNSVTRSEAIGIYNIILNLEGGGLSREAMCKYMPLRMKLKQLSADFEELRQETVKQCKPAGLDEVEGIDKETMQKQYNEDVNAVLGDWMKEKCGIDLQVFSMEEALDLIMYNKNLKGSEADFIVQYFVKP